jgi:fumarylpyruvate hydrolase
VNGETRQNATLDTMIHSVPAILQDLAKFYTLGAGDIIMTGTPAGVGPVQRGDTMVGSIDGLSDLVVNVV